nr:MAG TPA: hypothetical protein [Caudoviricetes sp.]
MTSCRHAPARTQIALKSYPRLTLGKQNTSSTKRSSQK